MKRCLSKVVEQVRDEADTEGSGAKSQRWVLFPPGQNHNGRQRQVLVASQSVPDPLRPGAAGGRGRGQQGPEGKHGEVTTERAQGEGSMSVG